VSALVKTAALLACGGLAGCLEWRPSKSTSAYLLGSGAIERAEAEDAAADMYATVENIRSLNELTDEAAVLLKARGDRLDATTRARLAGSIATVEQMAVRNTNLLKLESAGVRSRAERQRLVREGLAQPAFREAMEVLISFNQTTKAGLRSESDATAAELETLETEVASEAQALGVPSSTASIEQRIAALENSLAEGSSGLSQQQDRLIRELEAEQSDLQSQIDDIEPAWRFHADLRRRHKYVPGSDFDTLSNNPYRRVRRERVWLMEEENLPSWEKKAPDREFLEYHEDYFVINPKEPPPFRDPG
jgi:hypothetical protein